MVDDTTRPTRSHSTNHDNSGREIDEDPLVELARIVSEDGSFAQKAPAKPVNPPGSRAKPDPFSADLEAELMEQFEASFAREAAGAVNIADAEEPALKVGDESEHAGYAASDSQALGAMAAGAGTQSDEDISEDYEPSGVYQAAPADDRAVTFAAAGRDGSDLPSYSPSDPPSDPIAGLPQKPPVEPTIEPIGDPYRVAPDEVMTDAAPGEPHPGAIEPDAFEPKAFEMEFADTPAGTSLPPLKEDFTPEFGVEAYARDPETLDNQSSGDGPISDELDYPVAHDSGKAADGAADDRGYDPSEEVAAMPPPAAARAGGRKGLIAVVGVLAVVVLGGGVAAYISKSAPTDTAMPVPVIKADTSDVKVMADATESAGTAPSLLDQLAGQQTKLDEKLIERIEEPQQIARVILPSSDSNTPTLLTKPVGEPVEQSSGSAIDAIAKTIDRVMQEPEQPTATPRYDPIGPRKVRTVVVKSDGTIISNDDAVTPAQTILPSLPAQPSLPAEVAQPARPSLPALETIEVASENSTQALDPMPVKTTDIVSIPVPDETVTLAGSGVATDGETSPPQPMQLANIAPPTSVIDAGGDAGDGGDAVQVMAALTGEIPRPKPANVPDVIVAAPSGQTIPSAGRSTSEPVNLLAAPAKTDRPLVTASTAPTTSGYLVQISSQRSADQARTSFADMQRRYKSVLGGFEPDIQRADLGDKGTYYRVRIGPMASREAALRLCEQLKSAGGNCFVTR